MEVLYIALKDTYQSFKSMFMIAFAFGIPLLLGGFYFLVFGNVSDGKNDFTFPETRIAIVNFDEGYEFLESPMGNLIADTFNAEGMPESLTTVSLSTSDGIQQALLDDRYDVALVIPKSFSADLFNTETLADVDIFAIQGENTTGVNIVKTIIQQLVTGLESSFSASAISFEEASKNGLTPVMITTEEYEDNTIELVSVAMESVVPAEETESLRQIIMKPTLGGMMIFFSFFTGCSVAATILEEERHNTLQRMFMAPFPRRKVIAGKFVSTLLVVVIQIALLLIITRLLFGLKWGPLWLQAAFTILTASLASSFGIFLLSFLKDPKSAGMIYSGINTAVGMLAISSTFTAREDVLPFSLVTPHAWPLRMIYQLQNGFSSDMLVTMGVILLWSVAFFVVGLWLFNRRYIKEA